MSKTIWKYRLPRDGQTIEIHECIVKVLHIAAQDGVPTLWAIVDPDLPRDGYTEVVAWGTGWPIDEIYYETDYWGSCEDGYGYVWHYFAATRSSGRDYERNDIYKVSDSTCYPLNAITTTPYTLSTSTEWNINQDTLDQLIKYIEGSCNTATNKCVQ